ncbi:hypothetical protein AUK04_00455 [Candidatus Roizmanbacteria bacterium CG2_30_33_16]|uniref:Chorismate mutase domain-containing protein n=4 Tax=Candidatus Roizmaniibacteriota TaxID=1752723 RepID=A0A2H0C4Y9_9BACT|nr:chorismate mutase [Candidatus Roizmanbacteria bacterium]OIP86533.1 MAG: hypothetical protein AUK04_00455 [Candidatus Roizmanbacteria bacterium CG2_30_33_16]PIP64440.1 MAG: hypothetical protein COW96_02520 [Candidatus Roizmanbacteria bacterium CG22_combo_CG10-13_8_21_14_all_33_16]PIX70433.1 MAG: hypothetical protein COZ39_04555 [Candidatus Roizmanbacteria bacterium CG_4_10_14_3_um_filter_33_21]PJB89711.1 MAG: hypothetical protein CO083_00250 [Candidatus Roizmanbacteria bacterium CG_4_9_14_0_8
MNQLTSYREEIDNIDRRLIQLLAKRFQIVKKVGVLKKQLGFPPLDKKRWKQVVADRLIIGNQVSLPAKFIMAIYDLIHKLALQIEKQP